MADTIKTDLRLMEDQTCIQRWKFARTISDQQPRISNQPVTPQKTKGP
jgi:hypothetical protein